jgi:Flp pilus assembly protein TadG
MPRRPEKERGTAAVEFALVLPLVMIVALALVQTGLLVRDRLLVEAAARAAARAAAVTDDAAAIREAALGAAPSLDGAALVVSAERQGVRGAPVTASVGYRAVVRVPFVTWLFGASVAMGSSATARQEFG